MYDKFNKAMSLNDIMAERRTLKYDTRKRCSLLLGKSLTVKPEITKLPTLTSVFINSNGHLIVSGEDEDKLSIVNGNLIFRYVDEGGNEMAVDLGKVVGDDGAAGAKGDKGNPGVSVTSSATTWAQTTSGTTTPSSGWVTTPPTAVAGQYMWSRTIFTKSDGSTDTTYQVNRNGANGATGATGPAGAKGDTGATGPAGARGAIGYTPVMSIRSSDGHLLADYQQINEPPTT